MRIRLSVLALTRLVAIAAPAVGASACLHSGTVPAAEPPPLAYQAPDIDEITGIETPDAPDPAEAGAAGSGAHK